MSRRRNFQDSQLSRHLFVHRHLTDEAILLLLDGELSARNAARAQEHILSCWSCRSRRDEVGQGIAGLVEFHNTMAAPYLPPPKDARAIFLARLDELAGARRPASQLAQWFRDATRPFRWKQISRPYWIMSALFAAGICIFSYLLRNPPVVSAQTLLNLTAASEQRSLQAATDPVVVQKIRINIGNTSVTRVVYRDVEHQRTRVRTDASGSKKAQRKLADLRTSIDWESLLDVNMHLRWRAAQSAVRETVIRRPGEFTLKTISPTGLITEADLTVRSVDFHAIEEDLNLQDHSRIEIAELSYDVVPFASVPTSIFGAPIQETVRHLPAASALSASLPSAKELTETEIKAESVLHGLGADLGEQISIETPKTHRVLIEGVVEDEARKQTLVAALRHVPNVQLEIRTIADAAKESRSAPSTTPSVSSPQSSIKAAPPLLEGRLTALFPDTDQRIAYVNQTLSLAQMASARAWALNRLASRYPAPAVSMLDGDARQQLRVLLTDHVSALRQDVASLQNQLGAILSRASNTPAANTALTEPLPTAPPPKEASNDWRVEAHRIHSSIETVHESITALLTNSQPNERNDPETIEINLRTSLTQLQTDLQSFDEKLRRPYLQ